MKRWHIATALLLATWTAPTDVVGQKVPVGPEFQINTYTTGDQSYVNGPRVASDAAGNFVVVWWGGYSQDRVIAQRFDSAGTKQGSEIQVSDSEPAFGRTPVVASDASGNFVVVWQTYSCGSYFSYAAICGHRFSSSGTSLGGEFQVSTLTDYFTSNPKVAADADGDFVVAWAQYDVFDNDHTPVFARRFDSTGSPLDTPEFQVNTYTTSCCAYALPGEDEDGIEVAADADGNFMVVWSRTVTSESGVFGQASDSAGAAVGGEFQVNTTPLPDAYPTMGIAADGTGRFIVTWSRAYGSAVRAQQFDGAGAAIGAEIDVTPGGVTTRRPKVAADTAGNFVVVWTAGTGTCNTPGPECDGDYFGIFGRQYDSTGAPVGGQFLVNTHTPYRQEMSSIAAAADGDFVVVWRDRSYNEGDNRDAAVFGQRFGDGEPGIAGKRLLIKNGVPDDPRRNKGVWLAKDLAIVAPERGGADDPQCHGDAPGTIKASIRFFSDGSAGSTQDTGAIALPCENWTPLGSDNNPKGFRYRDKELDQGPCKSALIKDGRLVKASCFGKGAADFTYDLMPGVDEGIVNVVLIAGSAKYCTAFDDTNGRDGSDGRQFLGRDAPAPEVCPTPPPTT
jgi:hypothetical protein